jgi:hypothetical protein
MFDPQPTYGRFTVSPAEPKPRDASEWLEDAEESLRHAQRLSLPRRERLALIDQAAECIQQAKRCL